MAKIAKKTKTIILRMSPVLLRRLDKHVRVRAKKGHDDNRSVAIRRFIRAGLQQEAEESGPE
jgi:metal-responsive CopG/Arc/MetJ family transcriptional regulator